MEELAAWINNKYPDSLQKVKAAYTWVVQNIQYSADSALVINHGLDKRAVIDAAFRRRKGVCENFAAIFAELCRLMGFQTYVVEGYTTQGARVDEAGHSWTTVRLDGDWFLFDPTWDSENRGVLKFFQQTGEEFGETHVPYDPLWALVSYPKGLDGKSNLPKKNTRINYKDSISCFLSLDSLQQLRAKERRMEMVRTKNQLTLLNQKVVKGLLEEQLQELQMKNYDKAVSLINQAAESLNSFISYRNAGFLPEKSEKEIHGWMDSVPSFLDSALYYLDLVDHSAAVLVFGTGTAHEKEKALRKKWKEQSVFLDQFLTASPGNRKQLLYQ